ncbi:uncharacterized protein G2W53_037096 [Senna tora]|uniref:Uncharacterized protein n=1 Tax=Senna tora TaxID=362788 RepID=A0A834STQ6_9FABA|nr:uncharacterized protein G2W53_037096 [Senna tora]
MAQRLAARSKTICKIIRGREMVLLLLRNNMMQRKAEGTGPQSFKLLQTKNWIDLYLEVPILPNTESI